MHNISIAVTLNGCTDTSNVFNLYIKDCGCDCKESHWGDIILTEGDIKAKGHPVHGVDVKLGTKNKANVPEGIKLECKNTTPYILKCNQPFSINANYICKDTTCPSAVTYVLTPPTGPAVTGNAPVNYTPTVSGTYTLMLYGWCNGIKCDSCLITFKVECKDPPKDCCKGSKWGEKTVTIGNNTQPFTCFKNYGVIKCKTPITVNANYICADASCPGTVTYSYTQPSGTTTGTLPATFTPTQSGWHWITIIGYCGGVPCDTCNIRFMVEGCDTTNCCPYEIKVTPKEVTYISNPTSTIVSNNFSISIPATANITEVRANVISYTIDDNFKGDCMKCVNLPFTWASTSTATNIATAPPKITMFGGATVPSFNGSGTGVYQNPREVVWNNGSNLNSPNITNISMSFILPPTPNIDCCELKGRICVKFIFRNDKCEECEAVGCFDFVIKKK